MKAGRRGLHADLKLMRHENGRDDDANVGTDETSNTIQCVTPLRNEIFLEMNDMNGTSTFVCPVLRYCRFVRVQDGAGTSMIARDSWIDKWMPIQRRRLRYLGIRPREPTVSVPTQDLPKVQGTKLCHTRYKSNRHVLGPR